MIFYPFWIQRLLYCLDYKNITASTSIIFRAQVAHLARCRSFFGSTPQLRQNPVSQLDLSGADAPEDKNNSSIYKMLSNKELG